MEYEVTYEDEAIATSTGGISSKGANSICFENTGNDNAVLNGNIPLNVGERREYTNLPNVKINKVWKITFAGTVPTQKVLIERGFIKAKR